MPTRNRSRPESSNQKGKIKPSARIYVLRAGAAEAMTIKTGISDGRHTEISGEGLTEGLQVITRTNTTSP